MKIDGKAEEIARPARGGSRLALLVGIALLLSAPHCWAVDLVTGTNYPPFADENLPNGGLASEIIIQAYKAVGIEAKVRHLPWKRGYDATLRGEFAGTFPYLRTTEREREFLFSAPLYPVRLMVFYAGFAYSGVDSLKGKTTCIELGRALQPEIISMIASGEVLPVETKDMLGCVRLMGIGRVDFIILNELVGKAAVVDAALPAGLVQVAEKPFLMTDQFLLVPRTAPNAAQRLETFNAGLAKIKASGLYDAMMIRYLGAD